MRALLLAAVGALALGPVLAQSLPDGAIDPNFRLEMRSAGEYTSLVSAPDDRWLVRGNFTRFDGVERPGLVLLRADGSVVTEFMPQLPARYTALVPMSDGGLLYTDDTASPPQVRRLRADGSPDPAFENFPVTYVRDVAISYPVVGLDGRIYTTGFSEGGVRLLRREANGRLDTTFRSEVFSRTDDVELRGVITSGGFFVSGSFEAVGGQSPGTFVRLRADGSYDPSFRLQTPEDTSVAVIREAADGGFFVGGYYSPFGFGSARLFRLKSDGSLDPGFAGGFREIQGVILGLSILPTGGVRVLMDNQTIFFRHDATTAPFASDLSATGQIESTYSFTTSATYGPKLFFLRRNGAVLFTEATVQPRGLLLQPSQRLSVLDAPTATPRVLGADSRSERMRVNLGASIFPLRNGRALLAGDFHAIGNVSTPHGLAVLEAGNVVAAPAAGGLDGFTGILQDVRAHPQGGYILFGAFRDTPGFLGPLTRILRLKPDGTKDPDWQPLGEMPLVLVPGGFDASDRLTVLLANGADPYRLRRVLPNGQFEAGLDVVLTGPVSQPKKIHTLADGSLILASPPQTGIVRLRSDGTVDPAFPTALAQPFTPALVDVQVGSDGSIFALQNVGPAPAFPNLEIPFIRRFHLAKFRPDGTADASFNAAQRIVDGDTRDLILLRDGRSLVSGDFVSLGERARNGLARLTADGRLDATFIAPLARTAPSIYTNPPKTGASQLVELADGSLLGLQNRDSQLVRLLVAPQPSLPGKGRGHLINLSTRGEVQADANVMIAGFVVSNGTRDLVLRALGPSLGSFGIQRPLSDPRLTVYDAAGQVVASNDDWQTSATAGELQASGLAPSHPREAALRRTFAQGAYTVIVQGAAGSTGIAIVEAYDLAGPDATSPPPAGGTARLVNLSTRARVAGGESIVIAGFAIRGGSARVAVRALGPSLAVHQLTDLLPDPKISVIRQEDGYTISGQSTWTYHGPGDTSPLNLPNPRIEECLRTLDLPEGNYTILVEGETGPGLGLIEIYELPDNGTT